MEQQTDNLAETESYKSRIGLIGALMVMPVLMFIGIFVPALTILLSANAQFRQR